MKFSLLKNITPAALLLVGMVSCEKKIDPIDDYKVVVDYKASNEYALTGDKEVNPKDSIFLDFTVNSPTEITYIEIQKNGVRIDTFNVSGSTKTSFSGSKGYRADSAAGDYTFRVLARNAQATFMGDGGKTLTVTVKPDFYFWSYRIIQVPDSTSKTNKCYYSTADGKMYSFTDGAANSGTIDFGYYYDTTTANKHTIYALNQAQPQLNFYDISSWTKNATVFKKMASSVNFVTGLTSSGAINTLIKNNMTSGTASKVTALSTSSGSNVIGFKTAAGKYGAILIRYIKQDSPAKETQVEIDVKVQK